MVRVTASPKFAGAPRSFLAAGDTDGGRCACEAPDISAASWPFKSHRLRLPWPDGGLFPNAIKRLHWGRRSRLIRATRSAAIWECRAAGIRALGCDRVRVSIAFTPPVRRGRPPDDDGMIGAFKAARDGIADAVGVDDGRWVTTYEFCPASGAGHVEVTIEELP